jgi:purine-binding chemotaxis protein CheW
MPTPDAQPQAMQVLCVTLGGQSFGVPIAAIQDVLRGLDLAPVPTAPPHIAGICNLRGRIVTAVCLHRRMYGTPRAGPPRAMNVVVDSGGELYALVVDAVGDVLTLAPGEVEPPPLTLAPAWAALCTGVYKGGDGLMVVLDPERVIHAGHTER